MHQSLAASAPGPSSLGWCLLSLFTGIVVVGLANTRLTNDATNLVGMPRRASMKRTANDWNETRWIVNNHRPRFGLLVDCLSVFFLLGC